MAYLAFLYDDYYCYGIMHSFAGSYKDHEEACKVLRGERWEKQNLEVLNTETFGITRYKWLPLYNYTYEYGKDGTRVEKIRHRWTEDFPIIELQADGVRRYGHNNVFFDAGEWKRVD